MHMRPRPQVRPRRRLLAAVLTATILAGTAAIVRPFGWTPICAVFDEGSIEWYLFMCYIDAPPKGGKEG